MLIAFISNGPQPDMLLLSVPGLRQDRNQPLSSTQKYQHIRYTFYSFASQGRSQELRVSSQSDRPCHAMPCHAEKGSSEWMPRIFLLGRQWCWLGCKNLSLLSILSLLTSHLFFFNRELPLSLKPKIYYFLFTQVWGRLVSKDWTLTVCAYFQEYTGIIQAFKVQISQNHKCWFLQTSTILPQI